MIVKLCVIAAVGFILYLISKQAKKKISATNGIYTLKPNITVIFVAISCLLFFTGAIITIANIEFEPLVFLILVFAITLMGYGLVTTLAIYFNHRVSYDSEYITITSKWKKTTAIRFTDIQSVSHSGIRGVYILHLKDGRKLSINQMLIGIVDFLKSIGKQCGLDMESLILKVSLTPNNN